MSIETAFLIALRPDGSFFVSTNVKDGMDIERAATNLDVKHGCNDILNLINNNDLANLILTKMAANAQSESERTASSIRQALEDKGIL